MMILRKKKVEIQDDTVLQRDPEQEFTYIDGEVVMLSLKRGEYFGLDEIGSRIWEILEKPIPFSALVDQLLEEFEVGREECENDTREYLEILYKKELLVETT